MGCQCRLPNHQLACSTTAHTYTVPSNLKPRHTVRWTRYTSRVEANDVQTLEEGSCRAQSIKNQAPEQLRTEPTGNGGMLGALRNRRAAISLSRSVPITSALYDLPSRRLTSRLFRPCTPSTTCELVTCRCILASRMKANRMTQFSLIMLQHRQRNCSIPKTEGNQCG